MGLPQNEQVACLRSRDISCVRTPLQHEQVAWEQADP
jgi:hypothetical protein